ncbi:MAG: TetR/AcrR family transcriptional regulator [Myxococcales bacterium]|nr:TetR/AcrR family transcriptional regulator [Myxococcales bacterium]
MTRQKEYDQAKTKEATLRAFWLSGYDGTSLADLELATGLDRRQLYNAAGSKRALFLGALEDFGRQAAKRFLRHLECGEGGVESIRQTLEELVSAVDEPNGQLGCLICNTARERIAEDPEIAAVIRTYFRRIERAYRTALERAATDGDVSDGSAIRSRSRYLLGIHVSLCVLARAGEGRALLEDIAYEAIRSLSGLRAEKMS